MLNYSIGIIVVLAIQIFLLLSIVTLDCSAIKKERRTYFKYFLIFLTLKQFCNIGIGSTILFAGHSDCDALHIAADHIICVIDLTLCANLILMMAPPSDITIFNMVNPLASVMIASFSGFINQDKSFVLLMTACLLVVFISFFTCNIELCILFMLYAVSFILQMWLTDIVMVIYSTVVWAVVFIWFTIDRRSTIDEQVYTVPDMDNGLQTIELN